MNEQIREQLDRLVKNLESRKQSEKLLILGIALSGMILIYLTIGFDPLRAEIDTLRSQTNAVNSQIASQQRAYAQMIESSREDPNKFANERLAVLTRDQAVLDADISSLAGDLVTPDEMTAILTTVLERFSGLDLLYFRNQNAVPLRTDVAAQSNDSSISLASGTELTGQVYSHGLTIEFQGDYFSTLKYLRFLEEVSGSFFWDSISFRQLDWPKAHVTLEIHTLSTNQGFIGV